MVGVKSVLLKHLFVRSKLFKGGLFYDFKIN